MPTISVIVPVFNTVKYISRCVESILSQTYTEFELLLIDDGSNDKSGDVCDEYARIDSRVTVFHKENGGVSSARNLGLANARGEWITFSDADDCLNPTALEQYVAAATDGKADIIRAGYCKCFSDGTAEDVSCHSQFDVTDKAEMLSHMERTMYYGFLWNSFFRRDIIGTIRFDEDISWCEDHLFSLMCYTRCKRIRFISTIVYYYRVNIGGSLSFPQDPIMVANVAAKELQVKFILSGSRTKATKETWQIYYDKIYKAVSIATSRGYAFFYAFYRNSMRFFNKTPLYPCNRLLSICYNPYVPMLVKYAIARYYFRNQ